MADSRAATTHPARLVATVILVLSIGSPAAGVRAAYSFLNPFHREQCGRAIRFAEKRLAMNASDVRARLILAEGLLCQGLEDDPWALDRAIGLLHQVVADDPENFFAQLELADALRKRFPASDDAYAALVRARALLDVVEAGHDRVDLAEYLAENTAAVADQRVHVRQLARQSEAELTNQTFLPEQMAALIQALTQIGAAGVMQAERYLEVYLMDHDDIALRTLYRAELMRGRSPPIRCRDLYANAASVLCAAPPSTECSLAQRRLAQLDRQMAGHTAAATGPFPQGNEGGMTR